MRPGVAVALVAATAFGLGAMAWSRRMQSRSSARLAASPALIAEWSGPEAAPLASMTPERNCTALEAEEVVRSTAMTDLDRVTCLAIGGKIDRARQELYAMSDEARAQAIADVFSLAHPIADRGDDASAGPIMELVVEFTPTNYMAVFHAGMAAFALGHDDVAGPHLQRFVAMYMPHDVWRQRAEQALAAIAAHTAVDERQAR
jgi:hypothetical protein